MSLITWKRQLCDISMNCSFTEAFPTEESFLQDFLSAKQTENITNVRLCIFGDYPTLGQLNSIYNNKRVAEKWLVKELRELEKYFGFSKRLDECQLKELPRYIIKKYGWLKVSEILLFLWKCKEVDFGEFYGQIDPQRIMTFLAGFLEYRNEVVLNVMEEINQKDYEWHCQNAVQSRSLDVEVKKISEDSENAINKALSTHSEKEAKLRLAAALANNVYDYDSEALDKMCECWKNRYGCTPQEYISKTNDNNFR